MKIVHIVVKPGSRNGPYVKLNLDGSLLVCVREPALEGKANNAVIKELAKYYGVPKSHIKLKKGLSVKYKTFGIQ